MKLSSTLNNYINVISSRKILITVLRQKRHCYKRILDFMPHIRRHGRHTCVFSRLLLELLRDYYLESKITKYYKDACRNIEWNLTE